MAQLCFPGLNANFGDGADVTFGNRYYYLSCGQEAMKSPVTWLVASFVVVFVIMIGSAAKARQQDLSNHLGQEFVNGSFAPTDPMQGLFHDGSPLDAALLDADPFNGGTTPRPMAVKGTTDDMDSAMSTRPTVRLPAPHSTSMRNAKNPSPAKACHDIRKVPSTSALRNSSHARPGSSKIPVRSRGTSTVACRSKIRRYDSMEGGLTAEQDTSRSTKRICRKQPSNTRPILGHKR